MPALVLDKVKCFLIDETKNFNLKLYVQDFVFVKYLQCRIFFLSKIISNFSGAQFFHVADSNARFYKFGKSDA